MKDFILLALTLLLFISACGNSSTENLESFVEEDPKFYNDQILSAIDTKEPWVANPFLIVNEFFGPEYHSESHAGFGFEQKELTNDKIQVVVTQEGLLDDSVYGEKRIIEFIFKNNYWIINTIKVGYKCQLSRGQQHYSGNMCS